MPGICVANTPAICGHPQTGSTTVFIAGNGVCRVQTDTAGGLIIGPGSQSVFVEGLKVSLPGDLITTHAPCPIPPIHCATTTNPIGNPSVFAGTGFTSDTVVGVGSGDPEDAPSPDLVDQNILYAKIMVKPVRAIEFIAIDFVIASTGASFDD